MLVTSSRRTSGAWFGAFGPGFKDKLIQDCSKAIWKVSCLHQAGFVSFTSNYYNARENNLKLIHLSCIGLNYAGKAMVFSKQPYGKGQNAFTRPHKSLSESFRIYLNPFLTEQSQDIVRQQVFSHQALFSFIEVQIFNRWTEQTAAKLTAINMVKHSNILKTFSWETKSICWQAPMPQRSECILSQDLSSRFIHCQLCPQWFQCTELTLNWLPEPIMTPQSL